METKPLLAAAAAASVIDGRVFVCVDVSGSMHRSAQGPTPFDVAMLIMSALFRRNPAAEVLPFTSDVLKLRRPLDPHDSMDNHKNILKRAPGGTTACRAPLRHLNRRKAVGDLVVFLSDDHSFSEFLDRPAKSPVARLGFAKRPKNMADEWEEFHARSPHSLLVLIDVRLNRAPLDDDVTACLTPPM